MQIGMVTACYKPVVNGVTRMILQYKECLERAGHEVTVFTLGDSDPAGEDADVVRSPALAIKDTGYYLGLRYSGRSQNLLREMDIVHCHHLFMGIELASRYSRCPIVYTNHTRYDLYASAYTPLSQRAADAVMRRIWPMLTDLSDLVIAPSESVRKIMLQFGVRKPIEVIENGIHLEAFRAQGESDLKGMLGIPDTSVLFIFVGRLSPEKNLETLLAQFAAATRLVTNLHLLLVGSGPLSGVLRHLANQLGVEGKVHFAGQVPYEEVPNYLAMADAFVTPSESEVHPLTVLEALAAGLPVIAIYSPAMAEIIEDGVTGALTSTSDGLAATFVEMYRHPGRRKKMGVHAQMASDRFDIHKTVERTLNLYVQLLDARPKSYPHRTCSSPFIANPHLKPGIMNLRCLSGRLKPSNSTRD